MPLATPEPVPREVATCPECGGALTWQATTSDIIEDMMLECEHEPNNDETAQDNYHRWWQSDWQAVIEKVKVWLEAKWHNVKSCGGGE